MLDDLTKDAKIAVMEYRAENHPIPECLEWLGVNFPDERRYSLIQFSNWTRSVEGKELFDEALGRVRKSARGKSFADKDSRLLAYVEVSEKILTKLREMEASDPKFAPLSRELRENFKCIKEEVDPFDINDEATSSAFDRLIARTAGTPWEKILNQSLGQTQQTRDN